PVRHESEEKEKALLRRENPSTVGSQRRRSARLRGIERRGIPNFALGQRVFLTRLQNQATPRALRTSTICSELAPGQVRDRVCRLRRGWTTLRSMVIGEGARASGPQETITDEDRLRGYFRALKKYRARLA